jgi:hypothetical protein
MDLVDEKCTEDRRVSSSSLDLFSSVHQVNGSLCVSDLLCPFTEVAPFDELEAAARYTVTLYGWP